MTHPFYAFNQQANVLEDNYKNIKIRKSKNNDNGMIAEKTKMYKNPVYCFFFLAKS